MPLVAGVKASAIAPKMIGSEACHRRSWVRSEFQPMKTLAQQRAHRRYNNQISNFADIEIVPILEDRRHVELDAIVARDHKEVGRRQRQNLGIGQRLDDCHVAGMRLVLLLFAQQLGLKCRAFFVGEPACLMGPVGQHGQHHEAQDHRRYSPDNINPLPANEAQDGRIVSLADGHEPFGNGRADDLGDWGTDEKPGQHPRSIAARKPVRQINDHARIKTSLGQPQQEIARPRTEKRRQLPARATR